jgi:hypothetical protein
MPLLLYCLVRGMTCIQHICRCSVYVLSSLMSHFPKIIKILQISCILPVCSNDVVALATRAMLLSLDSDAVGLASFIFGIKQASTETFESTSVDDSAADHSSSGKSLRFLMRCDFNVQHG